MPAKPDITSSFLEAYKALEVTLRSVENGASVLDYESMIPSDTSDKLRICRVVRNYLQHHADAASFIQPTKAMLDFLNNQNKAVTARRQTAKTAAKKLSPLKPDMTLRDVVKLFYKHKLDQLPAVDGDGKFIGVMTFPRLIQAISTSKSLDETRLEQSVKSTEWAKTLKDVTVIDVNDPVKSLIDENRHAVVTKKGLYFGVI